MAKHHKRNARYKRQKKRKKEENDFYAREQKLNKLINKFVYDYHHLSYPPSESEYNYMDKQRLEIKRLLSLQDAELWAQSHRRKRFYYKQLNKFKYHYVGWKRYTYYIYLYQRFDMPLHLLNAISFYKHTSHNIKGTVFAL